MVPKGKNKKQRERSKSKHSRGEYSSLDSSVAQDWKIWWVCSRHSTAARFCIHFSCFMNHDDILQTRPCSRCSRCSQLLFPERVRRQLFSLLRWVCQWGVKNINPGQTRPVVSVYFRLPIKHIHILKRLYTNWVQCTLIWWSNYSSFLIKDEERPSLLTLAWIKSMFV